MTYFPKDKWHPQQDQLKAAYQTADPFPHIVLNDFLNPAPLKEAVQEFPKPASDEWTHYVHINERKLAITKRDVIPPKLGSIIDELNSPSFISFLETLTGINGLLPDPGLEGGGLHQVPRGGHLNIHADFTSHPYNHRWSRRINLLLYLNEGWEESYGGRLELWDRQAKACVQRVLPLFNRCVIFSTDKDSFHGHPHPLTCPPGTTRKSIALYYFTEGESKAFTQSTEYRADPKSSLGWKLLVWMDKWALRIVDFLKRRLGLRDETIGKLLKLFSKLRPMK